MRGGGVCGAIFEAAGAEDLQKACNKIGYCATGDAVITEGFHLCRYIIHAVGPIYFGGLQGEAQLLYECYRRSLNLCKEYHCQSITFPLISSGIYGYPVKKAWVEALKACDDWVKKNNEDIDIGFAVLSKEVYEQGLATAGSLKIEVIGE